MCSVRMCNEWTLEWVSSWMRVCMRIGWPCDSRASQEFGLWGVSAWMSEYAFIAVSLGSGLYMKHQCDKSVIKAFNFGYQLRSLSFVLAMGSMAFLLFTACYLLIDVFHIWSGTPFYFPGKIISQNFLQCSLYSKNINWHYNYLLFTVL